MDFDIIKTAGITRLDFATLVGVSRASVQNWVAGKTEPSHLIADRVHEVLESLRLAVERGALPIDLPDTRDAVASERQRLLSEALN